MRILLINYEFPPLGGGAAKATKHLAREFAAQGHGVTVLTSAFRGLPRVESMDGFTVKRIPTLRRRMDRCTVPEMAAFLASSVTTALRWPVAERPDVACAFFGLPSGPAAMALRKRLGVPYVVSLRGGDVPGFQPYDLATYHALTSPIITACWRGAAAVVANSRGLRSLAEAAAADVPIDLVANGVDADLSAAPASLEEPVIAFSGRFVKQKGLSYLIEALPAIARAIPGVHLDLIGDGPLRPALEEQSRRLGVAARVSFRGWGSHQDVLAHLRQASLFVLPSLDEGMSNALLEAMACGLPVVATNISGNEELVEPGGNGWLVPTRDAQAIAEAAVSILSDAATRQRMGAASRELAASRTWPRTAEAYLDLFETALSSPEVSLPRASHPSQALGGI
ncbi:MAG TPA: glycosyltransferase family 4 protein [Chloroflexota bacterium]|nr:glycosyltransferase family 4 protein [Chloroflexota bacterium]